MESLSNGKRTRILFFPEHADQTAIIFGQFHRKDRDTGKIHCASKAFETAGFAIEISFIKL